MDHSEIASIYPSSNSLGSDDSGATYVPNFCSLDPRNVMPVTTPYVLRKREEETPGSEENVALQNISRRRFLKKTSGSGTLVKKLKPSGKGHVLKMLSFKSNHLVLKSLLMGKKAIHVSDITACKNHGSTLTIYTKEDGVITLVMGSVTDAYAFSNVLG